MAVSLDSRTRIATAAFLLFCCALFLTAYSAREPRLTGVGSAVVSEVLRPVQIMNHWVVETFADGWQGYVALIGVRAESEHLKERVSALESENLKLQELRSELDRLRSLIDVKQEFNLTGIAANVIGYDASNWMNGVTIDRGSSDGLRAGLAVVAQGGLVGQVIATAPNSARVLLITDPASGVDGIIQATRARGVVEGSGGSECRWHFVIQEDEVKIGDRVVTSGMDGVFPKGLLIGRVNKIDSKRAGLFQNVEIEPTVDFGKLETVLVVDGLPSRESGEVPLIDARSPEKRVGRKK